MDKKNFKIYGFVWWLILLQQACSSPTDSVAERGSFFYETPDIETERLRNQIAENLLDSADIQEYLEKPDLPEDLQEAYFSFYESREYSPAWVEEHRPSKEAEELLEQVEKSPEHGLNSEDYKLQYLYHLKKKLEQDDVGLEDFQRFEKELTAAYLKLANHILRGRIDPQQFDALWLTDRRERDLAKHLQTALEKGKIEESLKALEPQYAGYQGLKDGLKLYKELEEQSKNWKPLPESLVLKPGDTSEYVPELAEMLLILGDLKEDEYSGKQVYDENLVAAVAEFQKRNGLKSDSILAEKTLSMLNIPLKERINQIMLNLERYRWLPERPEERHVLVNIPEFMLYVYEGRDSTFSSRVIVGEAYNSTTPVFNDSIEYVTFSPTWTVPVSIAAGEMLPRLRKNPHYLVERGFRLYESWSPKARELDSRSINWKKVKADDFPYRVVQNPGSNNSLGRVKFMFPNKMSIYLHDTPADYLFSRKERDLSHGCIRVEKPAEFARYLLEEQDLSMQEIEQNMNLQEPLEVVLNEKVPVMIEYRTAWMGPDGRMNFREDIYGHDAKQSGTLQDVVADMEEEGKND